MTQNQFERQLDQHLHAIRRQVLSGRYRFRPFVYINVPKTTGGTRSIAMSTIKDRIVQAILLNLVSPEIDKILSPCCYAYRKERSVNDAVQHIHGLIRSGHCWVFETDFQKFFDSLSHVILIKKIKNLCLPSIIEQLLLRYLRTPQMEKAGPAWPLAKSRNIGLPQGGVLSGMLANLYLADFDIKIRDHSLELVRYADDLVVLTNSENDAREAHRLIGDEARNLQLELHPDKSYILPIMKGFDFIGFRFRGTKVSVREANVQKFRHRIETILCRYTIHKTDEAARQRQLVRLIEKVNAKIVGIDHEGQPRSWISFFRLVNDFVQLRTLNTWIWQSISTSHQKMGGTLLSHSKIQQFGLRSLISEYYRVKKLLRAPYLPRAYMSSRIRTPRAGST